VFLAQRAIDQRDLVQLVRYEDLVAEPVRVLDSVLAGADSGRLRPSVSPSWPASRRSDLDEEDLAAIRALCGPAAAELGLSVD
jgi:hypothetical protein